MHGCIIFGTKSQKEVREKVWLGIFLIGFDRTEPEFSANATQCNTCQCTCHWLQVQHIRVYMPLHNNYMPDHFNMSCHCNMPTKSVSLLDSQKLRESKKACLCFACYMLQVHVSQNNLCVKWTKAQVSVWTDYNVMYNYTTCIHVHSHMQRHTSSSSCPSIPPSASNKAGP